MIKKLIGTLFRALRLPVALLLSVAVVLGLMVLLSRTMQRVEVEAEGEETVNAPVVAVADPIEPPPPPPDSVPPPPPPPSDAAPPPPPPMAAPAAALPEAAAPAIAPLEVGTVNIDLNLTLPTPVAPALAVSFDPSKLGLSSSSNLSGQGAFGGFARGSGSGNGSGNGSGGDGNGNGNGAGGVGSGYARKQGFVGKPLVPISTARPQMPDWACKQKIKGWVEVIFIVNPQGRVQDVRIIDANPRGVFEAAAIESVSHWIYPLGKKANEVKQRVDMLPEDCDFNYPS